MQKLLKNSLRALMMFAVLMAGVLFVVNAMDSNEKVKDVEETTVLAPQWFEYIGDPNDEGEIENYENYRLYTPTTTEPVPSCNNGTLLCAVKVIPVEGENTLPDPDELILLLDRNQTSPNRAEIKHKL